MVPAESQSVDLDDTPSVTRPLRRLPSATMFKLESNYRADKGNRRTAVKSGDTSVGSTFPPGNAYPK